MSQQKSLQQIKWLSTILILTTMLLTACGSSKSSIIGKWEVVSGTSIGTLYEFFEDGTVSVGGFAGKYSWPDQTHIKLEAGIPTVYTFNLTGDELTLTDSTLQSVLVMKRYKEFNLSQQVVAGTWKNSYPDNSGCFKGLGLDYTPQEIVLGADGTFTVTENVDLGIMGSGLTMNGQYTINGNSLHVSASGTEVNSGILGMGASQTQIQGEFDCAATISNSRLTFSDAQGQTVFVRAGQ